MNIHAIHSVNDNPRILGRLEVGKGKSPEDAVVKMVIEGVRLREIHVEHDGRQRLLAHGERDVLYDDGSGNELVPVRGRRPEIWGGMRGALVDT